LAGTSHFIYILEQDELVITKTIISPGELTPDHFTQSGPSHSQSEAIDVLVTNHGIETEMHGDTENIYIDEVCMYSYIYDVYNFNGMTTMNSISLYRTYLYHQPVKRVVL